MVPNLTKTVSGVKELTAASYGNLRHASNNEKIYLSREHSALLTQIKINKTFLNYHVVVSSEQASGQGKSKTH